MKKVISLALCVILVCLSGCVAVNFGSGWASGGSTVTGKGDKEMYTFSVGEISEIEVSLNCKIEYYAATSDTVTLEIQSNLMEYVTVEESNGVLKVRSARNINSLSDKDVPVLTVSTLALTRVNQSGAGTFTAHDTITAESFSLILAGAGAGKADLDVGKLSVSMAGAGSFDLSGRADNAELTLAGTGRINALSLDTLETEIVLSGIGNVSISCSDKLGIIAGGMGSVEYRGSPSIDLSRGGMVSLKQVN